MKKKAHILIEIEFPENIADPVAFVGERLAVEQSDGLKAKKWTIYEGSKILNAYIFGDVSGFDDVLFATLQKLAALPTIN